MDFLRQLTKEIILEEYEGGPAPKAIQTLLLKLVYAEPFIAQLYSRTNTSWIKDPSIKTAGVRTLQGKILFYYNPTFIDSLTESELNFLLQHELYHITRSHESRGFASGATTKHLHYLMNVAQDAIINQDCIADGGFGGRDMKVIDGAWFITDVHGAKFGSISAKYGKDGVCDYGKEIKDGTDVYKGSPLSEPLYKWMLERDKWDEDEDSEDDGGGGGGGGDYEPWEPKIGDIIFNKKTKEYGRVTGRFGEEADTTIVTEEEAKEILKNNKGSKKYVM